MDLSSPYLYTPSVLSLLAFNLVPLFGALFWGWNQGELILLYWSESAIIGFYTLLKMALASPDMKEYLKKYPAAPDKAQEIAKSFSWMAKLGFIAFFIIHFGGFMIGHLVFILALFGQEITDPLVAFGTVLPAFGGLFLSHGLSFGLNYLWNKEYKTTNLNDIFGAPYPRIVLMHFAIILGAFIQMPLLILVIGKTILDLGAHVQERERFSARP
jgi:hypothetical protein